MDASHRVGAWWELPAGVATPRLNPSARTATFLAAGCSDYREKASKVIDVLIGNKRLSVKSS